MTTKMHELYLQMQRQKEAYDSRMICELLEAKDYSDIDLDESNLLLAEMVDTYSKFITARKEWVALMPDEIRERVEPYLKGESEKKYNQTMEIIRDIVADLELDRDDGYGF